MINQIRQRFFRAQYPYSDPVDERRAHLLLILTWVTVGAVAVWILLLLLPRFIFARQFDPLAPIAAIIILGVQYINYRLLHNGQLRLAVWLFIAMTLLVAVEQVLLPNNASPNLTATPIILLTIPMLAASILSNRRGTLLVASVIIFSVIIAGLTQNTTLSDLQPEPTAQIIPVSVPDVLLELGIIFVVLMGFVANLEQVTKETVSESQQRDWIIELGTALRASASEEAILSRAVNLIAEQQGYLLARIYLADEGGVITRTVRSGLEQQILLERTEIRPGDPSGIAEVARTHQPVILTADDLPIRRAHMLASASAAAAVPIFTADEFFGVLDIQYMAKRAVFDSEIALLSQLATQIASALRIARTITNLQRAFREQEGDINRLQSQLQAFRQRDRQSLSDVWGQYMQGHGGALGYDLESGMVMNLIAANDLPVAIYETLRSGKLHTETVGDEQIVNVPIIFRNTTLGAMCFSVPREQPIGERQLEMTQIVAERLALALENTRLFEQSQAQALRERKASEVGSRLIGATDVRALLNLAAEQFNEALGAVHTQIYLQPDVLAEPLARTAKEEAR
jgi:GAF domain-containing protein